MILYLRKRSLKRFIFPVLACVVVLSGLALFYAQKADTAQALSGSDFKPGRIIDDAVFYNKNAASASAIQTFLNSRVSVCDTAGTLPATEYGRSDLTHAQYASLRGWSAPPYACLKDYTQDTPLMEAASGLCEMIPAGVNRSGAQIIFDVAQACSINPQVLIVLLQKEQSLVTDTWPLTSQYTNATGFACPDTAPCNPAYGGFFYQVYYAARQFQIYKKYPNNYNYIAGRNNNIYYNPNLAACGSSQVYIENQATAALYIYTPYQPNAAALSNLYGTGNSCSAYGNRNFWRIFNDWFGSTLNPTYSAQYRAQSGHISLYSGESQTIYMQFINSGTAFWKDDISTFPGYPPVRLATTGPINRASIFRSSSWLSSSRPNGTFTKVLRSDGWNLTDDQHTVQTGEIAEFQFKISVPSDQKSGTYREYFQPILEGIPNFNLGVWTYIDITVTERVHKASFHSQTSPYPKLIAGSSSNTYLKIKNTGDAQWKDDSSIIENQKPVRLATTGPINRASIFRSSSWLSSSRPNGTFTKVLLADGVTESSDQHTVLPGQIALFEFTLTAPANLAPGTYREYFQPILEGASNYSMGLIGYLDITVERPAFSASYSSQSSYPHLSRGSTNTAYFMVRNTGNMFWKDDISTFPGYPPVRLATTGPINRASIFRSSSWLSSSRPNGTFTKVLLADGVTESSDQHTVLPGQIALFEFTLTAPANLAPGTYREYFQPILEGAQSYDIGSVMYLDITVN